MTVSSALLDLFYFKRKELQMRRSKDSLFGADFGELSRAAAILAAVSFGCAGRPPSPPGEEKGGAGAPGEQKAAAETPEEGTAETEGGPPPEEVAADDPRGAFRAAQNAMKRRDFGALFDMLSRGAQEGFYADLKADAEKAAASASSLRLVRDVLGFDPAEAAKLPRREAFVKVMEGATEAAAKLARGVGARGKVVEVETEGETATVTVEYEDGPATKRLGEVKLVLEDGKWRLAEVP